MVAGTVHVKPGSTPQVGEFTNAVSRHCWLRVDSGCETPLHQQYHATVLVEDIHRQCVEAYGLHNPWDRGMILLMHMGRAMKITLSPAVVSYGIPYFPGVADTFGPTLARIVDFDVAQSCKPGSSYVVGTPINLWLT
jgi:hypothetical protein